MNKLTPQEKKFLKELVKRELEHYVREKKTLLVDVPVSFLKAGHDYKHFLDEIIRKLD